MENNNQVRLSSLAVVQVSDTTFALECNNKLYYIGGVLFSIIQQVKAGQSFPEIQARVAAEFNLALSHEKFDQILDDTLGKIIAVASAPPTRNQNYVYGQVKLVGERTLPHLTRRLDFLFHPFAGPVLLGLALAATASFLFRLHQAQLMHAPISPAHGLAMALGGYLFFAVVGLFHELGHATAATRYNISPKEIGFGFYLVLPVLYTDVTKIWVLPKAKRALVNLAGIYFQLLLNIPFYLAYEAAVSYGDPAQYLILSFFLTNATLALYSLNPFFRNDGYWLFGDAFAVPNLSAAARGYPAKCWAYLRHWGQIPFRSPGLALSSEMALLVYVVGRLSFVSWFSYLGYSGFYHSYQETMQRLYHQGQFAHETVFESAFYLLKVVLFCLLFLILLYRTFKPVVQRVLARLKSPPAVKAQPSVAVHS